MKRRLFLLGGLAALGGCTSASLKPSLVENASRYASEPYPVRLVDRSKLGEAFRPALVPMATSLPAGSIIVDTSLKQLFFVESGTTVRRYGVAVGASGHAWKGTARIERKAKWPAWYPTDDMHSQTSGLPRRIEPGSANPLGARALYLFQGGRDTLYRIHGTSEPWTIGTEASSGCIRMLNEDIIDLYEHVPLGAQVNVR